mmetsp:Transcript_131351/g.366204  ORF Transcript_131351/g.366204 Transcript_131351/m.366204 type:complete len:88 (-) Transcript_131351:8-271(-)
MSVTVPVGTSAATMATTFLTSLKGGDPRFLYFEGIGRKVFLLAGSTGYWEKRPPLCVRRRSLVRGMGKRLLRVWRQLRQADKTHLGQ